MSLRTLLLSALLLGSASAQAAIPPEERTVLVTFYNSLGGSGWSNNAGWMGPVGTECTWYGVRCNSSETAVVGIRFFINGMTGQLPAALGQLNSLEELIVAYNSGVTGAIPTELGSLRNLRDLDLQGCQLSGTIPSTLANLTKLERLGLGNSSVLSGNRFSGSIPSWVVSLPNLNQLYLSYSGLSGPVPAVTGLTNLGVSGLNIDTLPASIFSASLENLSAADNKLSAFPAGVLGLTNLKGLNLSVNPFSPGPIPDGLRNLTKLEVLGLASCSLTGELPAWIGSMLDLQNLQLGGNTLSGPIPPEWQSLKKLVRVGFRHNDLTGSVPAWIFLCPDLQGVDLGDNHFSGRVPASIATPRTAGHLPLNYLNLSSNMLSGSVPSQVIEFVRGASRGSIFSFVYNALAGDARIGFTLPEFSPTSQTIPPAEFSAKRKSTTTVELTWTPVTTNSIVAAGGYEILGSSSAYGAYSLLSTVGSKKTKSATVTASGGTEFFIIRSFTPAHESNRNRVVSESSPIASTGPPIPPALTITSIVPMAASPGRSITILGSGFPFASSESAYIDGPLSVLFGTIPSVDVRVWSSTVLTAVVPILPVGPVNVTIVGEDGGTFGPPSELGAFTVTEPSDSPPRRRGVRPR